MKYFEVLEKIKEGDTYKIVVWWRPDWIGRLFFKHREHIATYVGNLEGGFENRETFITSKKAIRKGYNYMPSINFFEMICE